MRTSVKFVLLTLSLLAVALISLALGSSRVDVIGAVSRAIMEDVSTAETRILLYVRLPRTLAAPLAGAALAVSGAMIQGVLRNPLAGPSLIGVNAGAGLFSLLAAALFPGFGSLPPIAAFVGAMTASILVYLLAAGAGASRMTVVLAGVAISAILSAILDTVRLIYPEALLSATEFMIGGFSGVTLKSMAFAAWLIIAGLVLSMFLSGTLDVLMLGDDTARTLGMNATLARLALLGIASLLAGAAVSFAGLIGFVGLMTPHAARFIFGGENKVLLPASALLGALITLVCDILSRVVFAPFELPCGILLAFLGGPYFIILLLKQRRRPAS